MKLSAFSTSLFFVFMTSCPAILAQENALPAEKKILAGYYPDWGKYNKPQYKVENVPYDQLSHVIWSFVSPNKDGSLRGDAIKDPRDLDQMVENAHSAGIKAILSLGGAGLCEYFAPVSKDDALREKFVAELTEFVNVHNLDGVDMDWEFSKVPVADEDTAAYNKLIRDIRKSLPREKTFSAALPCSDYYGKYFTAEVLLENMDWIGLMTYDITGDWDDLARFDSPLFPNARKNYTTWSWKQAASYWKKRGVPGEKLVFGVPTFGFVFSGSEGPGTDFSKGATEYTGYAKIMEMGNWEFFYDDVSEEPYAISGNLFATYENPRSAVAKSEWIRENNFAGAMVWELSLDYSEGGGQPIIEALSSLLLNGITPEGIRKKRIVSKNTLDVNRRYNYNALGQVHKQKGIQGHYFTKNR